MSKIKKEFDKIREPFSIILPYFVCFNMIIFEEGRELLGYTIVVLIAGLIGTISRNSRWATSVHLAFLAGIVLYIFRYSLRAGSLFGL